MMIWLLLLLLQLLLLLLLLLLPSHPMSPYVERLSEGWGAERISIPALSFGRRGAIQPAYYLAAARPLRRSGLSHPRKGLCLALIA